MMGIQPRNLHGVCNSGSCQYTCTVVDLCIILIQNKI